MRGFEQSLLAAVVGRIGCKDRRSLGIVAGGLVGDRVVARSWSLGSRSMGLVNVRAGRMGCC